MEWYWIVVLCIYFLVSGGLVMMMMSTPSWGGEGFEWHEAIGLGCFWPFLLLLWFLTTPFVWLYRHMKGL